MLRLSILFVVVFQISLLAQPNYLMRLTNPQQINEKSLDFDIIINSTDSNFTISSYQCSFSFDLKLSPSDSIKLQYIDGSSELANFPRNIIGYLNTDDINELIFTSGIGNEIISKKEKLVGKFIITSTEDISVENLNLLWNFSGSVNTILTDQNFKDITVPLNHKSFYDQVTNIEDVENIPNNFELSQNYPNPFNPTTKINFTLPEKGFVKLTIYNMIGETVMELLNQTMIKGNHTVEINANHLASGVYVYSINVAGKYSAVKKMMLLK